MRERGRVSAGYALPGRLHLPHALVEELRDLLTWVIAGQNPTLRARPDFFCFFLTRAYDERSSSLGTGKKAPWRNGALAVLGKIFDLFACSLSLGGGFGGVFWLGCRAFKKVPFFCCRSSSRMACLKSNQYSSPPDEWSHCQPPCPKPTGVCPSPPGRARKTKTAPKEIPSAWSNARPDS